MSDPSEFSRLILRVIRDDAAVVYINEVEGLVMLIDGSLQVGIDLDEPRRFFRLKEF